LKYGPGPNKGNSSHKRNAADMEIPSYKLDAMKLIINRIYRHMGKVFEELNRKVMRDDIMMRRKRNSRESSKDQINSSLSSRLKINNNRRRENEGVIENDFMN
jgi:hypothetical protein